MTYASELYTCFDIFLKLSFSENSHSETKFTKAVITFALKKACD